MPITNIPLACIVEINTYILNNGPGMQGDIDRPKLDGAIGRINNAIQYTDLEDIFDIASKYAMAIAQSHGCPDANKRTGLAAALIYLCLHGYTVSHENDLLADAMVDLVTGELSEEEFADVLYSMWCEK